MKKYIMIFFLSAIIYATPGFFAEAQIREGDIVLSITPQNPNPNQEVKASLGSHAVDLDKADISWSVNNKVASKGIGKKYFSFKVGNLGSPTILSATIDTAEGYSISKTMTIIGASVDMLWEAYDAYAPPFYRGKTLVSSQGKFKVVAIPSLVNQNGKKANPNDLSYAWTKDGNVEPGSSGWGKNYFIFQNSYLDKVNDVEVKVSGTSGGVNASGGITVQTTTPKILFYENSPESGVKWGETLKDGFSIDPNGTTIIAEPYFSSPKNMKSPELTFDWFLNGQKIETPSPKNILSIKPEKGQSGNATIKVIADNINTLFQNSEKQISVSF